MMHKTMRKSKRSSILIPKVVVWPKRFNRRPYELVKEEFYGPMSIVTKAAEDSVGMIIFWVNHNHTGIYLNDYSDEE